MHFREAHPVTAGDMIQITCYSVTTERPDEFHGGVNALAHVLEINPDGSVVAYFEKSQTISDVSADNFKILHSPATEA